MGCCGHRQKVITVSDEQKWDYINLSDFRSNSCLAPLSYAWLWILAIVSCAVYVADAFTAVNLLAFDKWTSEVRPKIPFQIVKWIFAITIIISYVFLLYRWIRAIRVIRSGSVTECYLEPLAAIFQSMRVTRTGQGWRRFLVFAELTKSKNGVNYIAIFAYFQFKSALIILVAQGPRIGINAMTLYAVMQAQLLPVGSHGSKERSGIDQFFFNIKLMVQEGNKQETVVYFTMLFSLVIWVIAALSLLVAVFLYIFFLWHYIPRSDGSLTRYCRRKIEVRLERIVNKKVRKAIEKHNQERRKEERKAIKNGALGPSQTLPTLPTVRMDDDVYSFKRSDTMSSSTTLPVYPSHVSRSNTMRPAQDARSGMPIRLETQFTNMSTASHSSDAPLLDHPGAMGNVSPMLPLDHFRDYPNDRPPLPYGPPAAASYSPMLQGRATPAFSREAGHTTPSDIMYSHSPALSRRAYEEFSPFDGREPHVGGPLYEMSPVDMTPTGDSQPPPMPDVLKVGAPATSQPSNHPPRLAAAAFSRAETAPPRAGLPASLQSAGQRRDFSQPLPSRGATPQQRSATVPAQQTAQMDAPLQGGYHFSSRAHHYDPSPNF